MHHMSLLFSDILKSNKYRPYNKKRYSLYVGLNLHGGNISDLAIKGGEDPEDFHVTLLYGYFIPRSDIEDSTVRIQNAIEEIKSNIPDKLVFYHERRFEASESSDNKDVIVAAVAGGILEPVHNDLLKALKKRGIEIEKTFPKYIPHMTLAYIEPGTKYECRALDHSAIVKDISIDIEEEDSEGHEHTIHMSKSFSELMKFNPYHDRLGRFSSSNGAASFTYRPGKSKAHDMAITREKELDSKNKATKYNPGKYKSSIERVDRLARKVEQADKEYRNSDLVTAYKDNDNNLVYETRDGKKLTQREFLNRRNKAIQNLKRYKKLYEEAVEENTKQNNLYNENTKQNNFDEYDELPF